MVVSFRWGFCFCGPVEVDPQRGERAIPAAGQRGQDGATAGVGQGGEDLFGDRLDVWPPVQLIRAEPPGRRSMVASWPNQVPRPSAVVSAAHTWADG
jgi:hypothetical protein